MLVPVKSSVLSNLSTNPRKPYREWHLVLVCGHTAWRKPKYAPRKPDEPSRPRDPKDVMPPPKRVHCRACVQMFWRDCAAFRRVGQDPPRSEDWLEKHLADRKAYEAPLYDDAG